eukprot:gene8278-biopygen8523
MCVEHRGRSLVHISLDDAARLGWAAPAVVFGTRWEDRRRPQKNSRGGGEAGARGARVEVALWLLTPPYPLPLRRGGRLSG